MHKSVSRVTECRKVLAISREERFEDEQKKNFFGIIATTTPRNFSRSLLHLKLTKETEGKKLFIEEL